MQERRESKKNLSPVVSFAIQSINPEVASTMTTATAATTTAAAAVTTDNYTCTGSTDEQLEAFGEFNFWSDGVVKPLICVVRKRK